MLTEIFFFFFYIVNLAQSNYISYSWINNNNTITTVQNFCIQNMNINDNCSTTYLMDFNKNIKDIYYNLI